jgi:hypothetical protein
MLSWHIHKQRDQSGDTLRKGATSFSLDETQTAVAQETLGRDKLLPHSHRDSLAFQDGRIQAFGLYPDLENLRAEAS